MKRITLFPREGHDAANELVEASVCLKQNIGYEVVLESLTELGHGTFIVEDADERRVLHVLIKAGFNPSSN